MADTTLTATSSSNNWRSGSSYPPANHVGNEDGSNTFFINREKDGSTFWAANGYLRFNGAGIPAGTVTAAKLRLYVGNFFQSKMDADNLALAGEYYDYGGTTDAGDYAENVTSPCFTAVDITGITVGAYLEIPLTDLSGITSGNFGFRLTFSPPGTPTGFNQLGCHSVPNATGKPQLVVTTSDGGGTTPVSSTRGTSWHIRATASTERGTSWHLRAIANATRGSSWDVRVHATSSRGTSWHTLTSVHSTRGTSWHLRAAVAGMRGTRWHTLVTAASSRGTSWSVRATTTSARGTTWHVLVTTSAVRGTSWHTLATVSSTRGTSWHVLGVNLTVSSTRGTSWHTRAHATSSRSTSWDLRAIANSTRGSSWHTLICTHSTRGTSWHLRAIVARTHGTSWSVLAAVSSTTGTSWMVASTVSSTRGTSWHVYGPDGAPDPPGMVAVIVRVHPAVAPHSTVTVPVGSQTRATTRARGVTTHG